MKFIRKPISLPSNYRFFYQISILLLMLEFCCSQKAGASTLKLQLLAWALRDSEGCKALMSITTKQINAKRQFNFWALDPALNRAIEFALADGYLILNKEKFMPAPKGVALLSYILESDVFIAEKKLLREFGKSVTESLVNTVLKNEIP